MLAIVQPKHVRYIKLGDGGCWAQQSFSEGVCVSVIYNST